MATKPFSKFELMIAWRYLRARKDEGGVSVISFIAFIGVALAVMALIVTFAVRTGFRSEFISTILGINGHAAVYSMYTADENGNALPGLPDYEAYSTALKDVDGVTYASPVVKSFVMASFGERSTFVEIYGQALRDIQELPGIAEPEAAYGELDRLSEGGAAIGSGIAQELGISVGDKITFTSAQGVKTAFGTAPRINAYEVVYIFQSGRSDVDRSRVFIPFAEAQSFFDMEGYASQIEIMVKDPEDIEAYRTSLEAVVVPYGGIWTWQNANARTLQALQMEDNVMFIILFILTLLSTFTIAAGLIMLVKNKTRDIAILRTMGLSSGSIMRIFFICGALLGILGTIFGVIFGSLFAYYIEPILGFINYVLGGGPLTNHPSLALVGGLPSDLTLRDITKAALLAIGLSFVVTIFPARRAAKLNPAEALRYD